MRFPKLSSKYFSCVGIVDTIRKDWLLAPEVENLINTVDSLLYTYRYSECPWDSIDVNNWPEDSDFEYFVRNLYQAIERGVPEDQFASWLAVAWCKLACLVVVNAEGQTLADLYESTILFPDDASLSAVKTASEWIVTRFRANGVVQPCVSELETGIRGE